MCKRVVCEQCERPTYSGCGKHVEQVLKGITHEDRCHCRELAQEPSIGSFAPTMHASTEWLAHAS